MGNDGHSVRLLLPPSPSLRANLKTTAQSVSEMPRLSDYLGGARVYKYHAYIKARYVLHMPLTTTSC